jgi:hypothetical protein
MIRAVKRSPEGTNCHERNSGREAPGQLAVRQTPPYSSFADQRYAPMTGRSAFRDQPCSSRQLERVLGVTRAYERSAPTEALTPCSGQGDTPDAASDSWRWPKPGHTAGGGADPCQSPAPRAALQGQIPRTNRGQPIKKPDCRLAIGPLTCFS